MHGQVSHLLYLEAVEVHHRSLCKTSLTGCLKQLAYTASAALFWCYN